MAVEKDNKINGEDFIAKVIIKFYICGTTMFKIFGLLQVFGWWFRQNIHNIKIFTFIVANGMEDELFCKHLSYPYERGYSVESFYEPPISGKEEYLSTLKHS